MSDIKYGRWKKSGEVLDYAGSREDMYTSDYDGINNIFRRFGSNYSIPIFCREE